MLIPGKAFVKGEMVDVGFGFHAVVVQRNVRHVLSFPQILFSSLFEAEVHTQ
jgi:hypothetical protein